MYVRLIRTMIGFLLSAYSIWLLAAHALTLDSLAAAIPLLGIGGLLITGLPSKAAKERHEKLFHDRLRSTAALRRFNMISVVARWVGFSLFSFACISWIYEDTSKNSTLIVVGILGAALFFSREVLLLVVHYSAIRNARGDAQEKRESH